MARASDEPRFATCGFPGCNLPIIDMRRLPSVL